MEKSKGKLRGNIDASWWQLGVEWSLNSRWEICGQTSWGFPYDIAWHSNPAGSASYRLNGSQKRRGNLATTAPWAARNPVNGSLLGKEASSWTACWQLKLCLEPRENTTHGRARLALSTEVPAGREVRCPACKATMPETATGRDFIAAWLGFEKRLF